MLLKIRHFWPYLCQYLQQKFQIDTSKCNFFPFPLIRQCPLEMAARFVRVTVLFRCSELNQSSRRRCDLSLSPPRLLISSSFGSPLTHYHKNRVASEDIEVSAPNFTRLQGALQCAPWTLQQLILTYSRPKLLDIPLKAGQVYRPCNNDSEMKRSSSVISKDCEEKTWLRSIELFNF